MQQCASVYRGLAILTTQTVARVPKVGLAPKQKRQIGSKKERKVEIKTINYRAATVHQKKEHVRITLDTTKLVHGYYKLQTDV